VIVKPFVVVLMHCVVSAPHTLFITTYRPFWMVDDPNFSQIVAALAGEDPTTIDAAISNPVTMTA